MKPLLLFCVVLTVQIASAQSLDYISVRKRNGQILKNFYTGSEMLLQMEDGRYIKGPVQNIRNDSVYLLLYDIRYYPTPWGSYVKDTISSTLLGMRYKEIQRIHLYKRQDFIKRKSGPIMIIGGTGYIVLNVLNGGLSGKDSRNTKRLGIAAGVAGLGFLLQKLFLTDGFSKKKHQIVYVDL